MVGKVGTGLDYTTRKFLRNRLTRDHRFIKGDIIPNWIHKDCTSNDLPTHFVHQDNMQVVEVFLKLNKLVKHFPDYSVSIFHLIFIIYARFERKV